MASAIHIMNLPNLFLKNLQSQGSHINIGSGYDLTIEQLAKKFKKQLDFLGS